MIYDLDNEYGGVILADSDSTGPALQVNSNAAGQSALAILSTASGSPMIIRAVQAGNASIVPNATLIQSTATTSPAVTFGRTVNGGATIGVVQFAGTSVASGAIMGFKGGFVSCTSIVLTSVANFDYVLPVEVNGVVRYIPLVGAAGVIGGATF